MESEVLMEYVICIVLPLFLILGIWLAKGTQDFIDEQNNRLRQDQKWRDENNG